MTNRALASRATLPAGSAVLSKCLFCRYSASFFIRYMSRKQPAKSAVKSSLRISTLSGGVELIQLRTSLVHQGFTVFVPGNSRRSMSVLAPLDAAGGNDGSFRVERLRQLWLANHSDPFVYRCA